MFVDLQYIQVPQGIFLHKYGYLATNPWNLIIE